LPAIAEHPLGLPGAGGAAHRRHRAAAGQSGAGHGWSRFDQARPIYLEGTAASARWRHPHAEWTLELAPLSRKAAWKVAEIKPVDRLAVLGFTFAGERGEPILRIEYLWAGGGAYGLRSSPA
jgi:hypothetical protein